jgi:hypothetical protein
MEFKKDKCYLYSDIEKYCNENNIEIEETGKFIIGENFLLINDKSFMLCSYTNQAVYKCLN